MLQNSMGGSISQIIKELRFRIWFTIWEFETPAW
jgi:hypothetical protein